VEEAFFYLKPPHKTTNHYMKSLFLITTLVLSSFTLLAQAGKTRQLPESLTMELLNGHKINLKEYVSKDAQITVVNFWATWCKPCKEELDNIQAEYLEDWVSKYGIRFIAVSMDDTRTKPNVQGVVKTKGWEYEILCNPDNTAYQALGFNSCPYTLLLDAKGNIVYMHTGYKSGDEEELEKQIQEAQQSMIKTEEKKDTIDEAAALRKAEKTAKENALNEDLKKLTEQIKAYQDFLNDVEKKEPFNQDLNKVATSIEATIKKAEKVEPKPLEENKK